jgi:hypothetical protein
VFCFWKVFFGVATIHSILGSATQVMLRTNISLRNVSSIRLAALLVWHYRILINPKGYGTISTILSAQIICPNKFSFTVLFLIKSYILHDIKKR